MVPHSIYHQRCVRRTSSIIKDPHKRSHSLFSLLLSGKSYGQQPGKDANRTVKDRKGSAQNPGFPVR
eukprot:superscaffoldBa00002010_g12862